MSSIVKVYTKTHEADKFLFLGEFNSDVDFDTDDSAVSVLCSETSKRYSYTWDKIEVEWTTDDNAGIKVINNPTK